MVSSEQAFRKYLLNKSILISQPGTLEKSCLLSRLGSAQGREKYPGDEEGSEEECFPERCKLGSGVFQIIACTPESRQPLTGLRDQGPPVLWDAARQLQVRRVGRRV